LNPHPPCGRTDFKSVASADFATRAFRRLTRLLSFKAEHVGRLSAETAVLHIAIPTALSRGAGAVGPAAAHVNKYSERPRERVKSPPHPHDDGDGQHDQEHVLQEGIGIETILRNVAVGAEVRPFRQFAGTTMADLRDVIDEGQVHSDCVFEHVEPLCCAPHVLAIFDRPVSFRVFALHSKLPI
jgi:hypothetical protein